MKQVVVVDELLMLPRGKLAAQAAHAALAAYLEASDEARSAWLAEGMPKVVLRCEGATRLRELEARAREAGLPAALVRDAGRTVVAAGTLTCLGIGPAPDAAVDSITGSLALVR